MAIAIPAALLALLPAAPKILLTIFVAAVVAYEDVARATPSPRAPTHVAQMRIVHHDTRLKAELYEISNLKEYDRALTVRARSGSLRLDMQTDWGRAGRASVYLVSDNEIAVLGPAHDDYFVSLMPLRRLEKPTLPSRSWVYLGAFDLTRQNGDGNGDALRFFKATEQIECIPTLTEGDAGGPYRAEHYRRRC